MKNNKKIIYYIVNLLFIIVSILFINFNDILKISLMPLQILGLTIICILIHLVKFIRIYFILLEEKISIKRMIKIYIKTSFVSIVLPFKTGELFKIYSYGYEIDNYPKSIISVTIDKLFDAIVLCTVIIPYQIITGKKLTILPVILLIFIFIILGIAITFEGTYYYLNKFFIINGKSKKSIYALKLIEKLKNIYLDSKNMLKGRIAILLGLTAISWALEISFLFVISKFVNLDIKFENAINYINDAFLGTNNFLFNKYIYICTFVFLVIMTIIYAKKFITGGKKWKK